MNELACGPRLEGETSCMERSAVAVRFKFKS